MLQGPMVELCSGGTTRSPQCHRLALTSFSNFRGLVSLHQQPGALTAICGQLAPLVHGRAGSVGRSDEDHTDDIEEWMRLEQRRRSHASASSSAAATSNSLSPASYDVGDGSSTNRSTDLRWAVSGSQPALSATPRLGAATNTAAAAAAGWELPQPRRSLSEELTPGQVAVQLLRQVGDLLDLRQTAQSTVTPQSHRRKPPSPSLSQRQQQQEQQQQAESLREIQRQPDSAPLECNAAEERATEEAAPGQPQPSLRSAPPDVPAELLGRLDKLALREALEVVQRLLPRLSVGQLQSCLEVLAAAGCTPNDSWVLDFFAATEPLLAGADATEVYGMLAAMRDLRLRPGRRQWLAGAAGALSRHLAQLSAPQVVDLLGCFADLALPPPPDLLSRAFALLLPDLPHLPPRLATDLLASCSRMRGARVLPPPPHVMAALYDALPPEAVATAPPQELCRLAAALAALHAQPPPGMMAAVLARADEVVGAAAAPLPPSLSSWLVENGGLASPPGSRVLKPRRGRRQRATVEGDAELASAAAPPPLLDPVELTPPQLSKLLRDLHSLAVPLPKDWGRLCGGYLLRRTDARTPAVEVSYLLGSIARAGLDLDPEVVRVVATRLTTSLVVACDARRRRRCLHEDLLNFAATGGDAAGGVPPGGAGAGGAAGEGAAAAGWSASSSAGAQEDLAEGAGGGRMESVVGADAGGDDDNPEVDLQGSRPPPPDDADYQWTPQVLSTTTIALVPFAHVLPPALLRALYANLLDTLERFDLPHLTATLHALPRLAAPSHGRRRLPPPPPPPAALLSSYLSCLHGRMRRMQPWQLSMCLFSLLRLGVRPDAPWMEAYLGRIYGSLPAMNEVQIASIAWVVARLGYRPAAPWVDRLLAAAGGRLSCFSPRHLCQLVWAVGAVGYRPSARWMARWQEKAQAHFRTTDGRTLAALAWTAASVGHEPGGPWLQELCQHLAGRLPHTPPRAVATTLASLLALAHSPPTEWLDQVAAHVHRRLAGAGGSSGGGRRPMSQSSGTAATVAAAGDDNGGLYTLQDLAHVCHSFALLGYRPGDAWLDHVAVAAAQLALLGPVQAGGRAGWRLADDHLLGPTKEEKDEEAAYGNGSGSGGGAAAAAAAAAIAHAKHIAMLMLALARLRRRPQAAVWSALLDGLHPCLPYAEPQSLAVVLSSAAALRLSLPREHEGALLLATHRRLGSFSGRGLAMALRGFVEVGVHPGMKWLGRLEEVLAARQEEQRRQLRQWQDGQQRHGSGGQKEEREGEREEASGEEDGVKGGEEGLPPPPPPLLLGGRERCAILWAVVTLATSRLQGEEEEGGEGDLRPPSSAAHVLPASSLPPLPGSRPGSGPTPPAPSASLPPARRWVRKPGLKRQALPPQLQGLMALLLPGRLPPHTIQSAPQPGAPVLAPDAHSRPGALSLVFAELAALSGQDLAIVCWALGRLRLRPPSLTLAVMAEVRRRVTAAAAAAVKPSRARRNRRARRALREALTATSTGGGAVAGEVKGGGGAGEAGGVEWDAPSGWLLGPRALAMAYWGLSSIGLWPSVQWQAVAAEEVLRQARQGLLPPHELSTVLAALARWRRLPRRGGRVAGGLGRGPVGQVSPRRQWSRRRRRQEAPQHRNAAAVRAPGSVGDGDGCGVDNGVTRPTQSSLASRESSLSAPVVEVAEVGSARLGDRDSRWQSTAASNRTAEARLRACTRDLAKLALTAIAADFPPAPSAAPEAMAAAGATPAAPSQPYDARSMATVLWALVALGVPERRLPDPWVAAFMPVSLHLLAQLPPRHRVTMLDSLSRLGLRPGAAWRDQAEQVVLSSGLALASSHRGLDLALRRMARSAGAAR